MILPQKIIDLKENGDIKKIAVSQNISKPTIINAFKGKKCTRKTVDKITLYFKNL